MIITTLAIATILIGKPNQLQPSKFTQQEVVVEQQIIQPSTEVYIEEIDVVNTLNIQVDTIEIIEEEINHDDDNGWIPIEWNAIEIIEEEEIPILVDTIQIQY